MSEIQRIDPTFGDELFAERQGKAAVSFEELVALEDGGAAFVAEIKAYVATHPKLDVVFLRHSNALIGDELEIRWRWRG